MHGLSMHYAGLLAARLAYQPEKTSIIWDPCQDSGSRPAGQPWDLCPRTALRRQLERLESAHSMTLKVGFELEFYLLRPRRDAHGVVQQEPLGHSHLYSQSSALLGAATGDLQSLTQPPALGS